ncbi:MAG: hypothetical protein ABSG57_10515 [Candidatus Bathyarchaeia archaeon]
MSVDMEMAAVKDVKNLGHGRHNIISGFIIAAPPRLIELNMERLER